MAIHRIVVETFPALTIRSFHVNERISQETFYSSVGERSLLHAEGQYSPLTLSQVRAFYAINGVEEVNLYPYEVGITIGQAFYWQDIVPLVVDTIKRQLDWHGSGVEIEYLKKPHLQGQETNKPGNKEPKRRSLFRLHR